MRKLRRSLRGRITLLSVSDWLCLYYSIGFWGCIMEFGVFEIYTRHRSMRELKNHSYSSQEDIDHSISSPSNNGRVGPYNYTVHGYHPACQRQGKREYPKLQNAIITNIREVTENKEINKDSISVHE